MTVLTYTKILNKNTIFFFTIFFSNDHLFHGTCKSLVWQNEYIVK